MHKFITRYLLILLMIFINSAFAHTFKGEVEVLIFDDFKNKKSETMYRLHEGSAVYQLDLPQNINTSNLLTGDHITIEGDMLLGVKDNHIKVNTLYIDKKLKLKLKLKLNTKTVDKRSLLTLIVNFTDKPATTTISAVDSDLYTKDLSVKTNYLRSSFNQLQLIRTVDKNGNPSIYSVNLNYPAGTDCNIHKWSEDAKTAIAAQGVDLNAFRHHMFLLPAGTNCPWLGVGQVGCETGCKTWILAGAKLGRPMAHEFGHNLGLSHSATDLNNDGTKDTEYYDLSCFMGAAYREMNAPQRDRAGWFKGVPSQITDATTNQQYTIKMLDNVTKDLQVIRIAKKDGTGTYYFSYRGIGPFGMIAPYLARVNVHKITTGDRRSYYITSLHTGETFTDKKNKISVKVLERGWNYAIVDISLD